MIRRQFAVLAVGVLVAAVGCGGDEAEDASSTTVVEERPDAIAERGLSYASINGRTLELDMHYPAEPDGAPIVIGASGQTYGLTDEGLMVVSVHFRNGASGPTRALGDLARFMRAPAEELACAIRFARARAAEFGDDDPIVVLVGFSIQGGSAAHVALFGETLEERWDEFETTGGPPRQVECEVTDGSTHVDGLIDMAGVNDAFVPIYDGNHGLTYQQEHDPELQQFLASAIGTNPDLVVRLIHGTNDGLIPVEESIGFEAALADAGYDVQLITFDGGHVVPPTDLLVSTLSEVLDQ